VSPPTPPPGPPSATGVSQLAPSVMSDRTASAATNITPAQRMVSSCTGALATSLLMTPLDVVKTRLQVQSQVELECIGSSRLVAAGSPGSRGVLGQLAVQGVQGCPKCSHFVLNNGLMEHHVSASTVQRWRAAVCDAPYFRGTADAFVQIVRHEGPASLYNGLPPTLAMAVPATVLYFTAYDTIRGRLQSAWGGGRWEWLAPALAGSSARVLATTVVSPLELLRTIMMAEGAATGGGAAGGGTLRRLAAEVKTSGE
jgi:solute carrier family 25 protein 39/40